MKNSKLKWLPPIAVLLLAIAGAFATNTKAPSSAPVWGFIDNPQPCHISVQCSTTGNIACESGGKPAYAMNAAGTRCNLPVFKL